MAYKSQDNDAGSYRATNPITDAIGKVVSYTGVDGYVDVASKGDTNVAGIIATVTPGKTSALAGDMMGVTKKAMREAKVDAGETIKQGDSVQAGDSGTVALLPIATTPDNLVKKIGVAQTGGTAGETIIIDLGVD